MILKTHKCKKNLILEKLIDDRPRAMGVHTACFGHGRAAKETWSLCG